ncbi:MAG TPA: HAMP domain-containing sensor histidine kinase [Cytophagales bacterium]|nr:HAMP domain-containing sensor histidine kinase [Cytophagales bacterium]
MRLLNKFTLWYLLITALVLPAGGIIVFKMVQFEIVHEESHKLKDTVKLIAKKLKEGTSVEAIAGYQVTINEWKMDRPELPLKVIDTLAWFEPHNHNERVLKTVASYKINGKHYFISTFNYIGEPDEIATGVTRSLTLISILLLFLVVLANWLISKRILLPFNQTLQAIKSFNLKQKGHMKLAPTSTQEFKELNLFLDKMTVKALEDYRNLKEFSENASHELQTPLAIIRGKLELLMETGITEEQAAFISSIHNEIKKLSQINQSLTLLTKLENHEYEAHPINLSNLINHSLTAFEELIEMKSLKVEKEVEENVFVRLNPFLADILLKNLLSNAIRHNVENGSIKVALSSSELIIKNTGNPPEVPLEQMFKRFKKTNQSSSSIGLGLAIVKQICDLNHFKIQYTYENALHQIRLGLL